MISLTALAFMACFVVGCFATLIINPFFGVILYEIEYFLNPPIRWWFREIPHIRYSFVISILMIVAFLLQYKKFRRNRVYSMPMYKWLTAMAAIIVVTYIWAVDTTLHARWMSTFLTFATFAVLLYKMTDEEWKLELALNAYLCGIFYIAFVAWQTGRTGDGRLEGIGGPDCMEVNGTAAVLSSAIPLLTFYALYGKKKWVRVCAFLFMAFTLNGLVLLNSRGAFIATMASACYFAFFALRHSDKSGVKLKIIAGTLAGGCLFLYLADAEFWMRMQTLQNIDPEEGSGGRWRLWMKTFEMLHDHPFGMGAMGYQVLSPQYLPVEWLSRGEEVRQRAVHSVWFEVLSEYGYHGLLIFLGYISSSFLLLRRVRVVLRERGDTYHLLQSVALEGAFIGFLAAATFINRLYSEMMYWLPAFIAAFANVHLFKKERQVQESRRSLS